MINKRINILITIESFYDGGAEIFAIRLANEMIENANIIFLELYPYRSGTKNQKKIINSDKIRLIQLGKNYIGDCLHYMKRKSRIRNKLFSIYSFHNERKVISIIKKNKIQIVHSHSWETDLYFSRLKNSMAFKLVSTMHGHYELLNDKGAYFEENAKYALNKIDKVVYLTDTHAATLNSFNIEQKKRKKIFHGFNYAYKHSITSLENGEILKFALAARGIPEKGWKETIEAFSELQKKYANKLELHLVGNGSYIDSFKKLYESKAIFFHGYRQDVMSIIKDVHIGLLPSYYKAESLPNSVIEYLICGKPVIATKIGAIEEMISFEDKTAGILIGLTNEKINTKDIISAVEIYLNNPCLVKQHSATALMAAKKFEMQNCVNSHLELYQQALST